MKTSKDWAEEYQVVILDPDGWDRIDFEKSWTELITHEEFDRRLSVSTVIYKKQEG